MQRLVHGCFNRESFKPVLRVQDGWMEFGSTRKPVIRSIPFRMTGECQYTHTELGQADAKCIGCNWRHQP
jgi:hypothetical protein